MSFWNTVFCGCVRAWRLKIHFALPKKREKTKERNWTESKYSASTWYFFIHLLKASFSCLSRILEYETVTFSTTSKILCTTWNTQIFLLGFLSFFFNIHIFVTKVRIGRHTFCWNIFSETTALVTILYQMILPWLKQIQRCGMVSFACAGSRFYT